MDIKRIKTEGFVLSETNRKLENVSLISLRSAIKAYFNTYRSLYGLSFLKDTSLTQQEKDSKYTITYIENACDAIVNFHHFVELIIKDILRQEHVLLTIDASRKHNILYDLLFNQNVNEIEIQNTKQLEFSEALQRLLALIKSKRIDHAKYSFFLSSQEWLDDLNYLRNRIAHRGVFVLRYQALDYLFGKFAFPFLMEIIALPDYNNNKKIWKYNELDIELDPIEEIANTFKNGNYDLYKIALLKELGRAAYENPIRFNRKLRKNWGIDIDMEIIKRSEALANYVLRAEYCQTIKKCPVCGLNSLVLFNDSYDDSDEKKGTMTFSYTFTYSIKCFCCTFELDHEIELKDLNLPIENYWQTF